MEKVNTDEIIENISTYLKSDEISFQAAALSAFNELIQKENLTKSQKKVVISFIKNELQRDKSSLRTDCIKTTCLIGSKDFQLIEDLFPILIQELEIKNRFRTEIILDFLSEMRNFYSPKIREAITLIIEKTPILFNKEPHKSLIKKFWENCIENDFQFIKNYMDIIKNNLENYPDDEFYEIKAFISRKLREYEDFVLAIEKQQIQELNLKEQIMIERAHLDTFENQESGSQLTKESKLPNVLENQPFTNLITFTRLGLKKKDKDVEDDD